MNFTAASMISRDHAAASHMASIISRTRVHEIDSYLIIVTLTMIAFQQHSLSYDDTNFITMAVEPCSTRTAFSRREELIEFLSPFSTLFYMNNISVSRRE
jgi:hypothetical protein